MICASMLAMGSCAELHAPTDTESQKALLKDWALSRCLALSFPDAAIKTDASATAAAYLERGKQPIEAYEALDRLAEQFASRTYTGSSGSSFNTMKCIDLFHSEQLEHLASQLVRMP
jgi:hypothetical protein